MTPLYIEWQSGDCLALVDDQGRAVAWMDADHPERIEYAATIANLTMDHLGDKHHADSITTEAATTTTEPF